MENVISIDKYIENTQSDECEWDIIRNIFQKAIKRKGLTKEQVHETYFREINGSNNINFRCPICTQERNESFLQEKVRLYLEETNYTILHEEKCTIIPRNPKTKYHLPFDNEIKELKLILEVMGSQHYKINGFNIQGSKKRNTTPEYELHYQKLKDRYKRISCIQQEYFYLEIPYWTDDKSETWKQLIDNKIEEIQETAKPNQAI